ncbi:MAG: NAD-dependent succinate-semialdehyde dehydrogenase, partial [Gammaproteobacteria bacterium]|nr:NAD-dependent succinate-semialdehyde dehydrogenase [Gammaproteobacteria bacterium]
AGCTVVCKPANETPLSAFAMVALAEEAGIPAGVINLVCGYTSDIGKTITQSPTVRKLTFTGSTEVGKLLTEQCAGTLKRLSMELGGNAPFIVFDDADLDEAVKGAIICKFRNAGQTCVCANRILVQDSVYDAFAEKFAAATEALVMGNGLIDGVSIGPLITKEAADKVLSLLEEATAQGGKVKIGGNYEDDEGYFIAPTILTDATPDMRICREEIFGPVAPLVRFHTEAEAIQLANDTPFGLAAYFYSRDIGRVWRVGEALEYGIVGINEGIISSEMAPFGGVKESGQGREGSKYGLDDYLEIKYMCVGGLG